MVYDASVLYPAPLRDLLLHPARTGLYRARWTEDIHQEWMQNLLANRPDLSRQQLKRTRELMNRAVLDCLVTGYQELIPALTLPDPDDRHVLAAAIRCGADAIVTLNQRDFPADTLKTYGLEALHPDEFVLDLMDLDTPRVLGAVKNQRSLLRHPPQTTQELLETLKAQGLPRSAALLEQYQELLEPGRGPCLEPDHPARGAVEHPALDDGGGAAGQVYRQLEPRPRYRSQAKRLGDHRAVEREAFHPGGEAPGAGGAADSTVRAGQVWAPPLRWHVHFTSYFT